MSIVIRFGNCTWQLGNDASLIQEQATHANITAFVECRTKDNRPLPVRPILGDPWWTQQNISNPAVAGSVTAIRKNFGEVEDTGLTLLSTGNSRVQDRWMRETIFDLGDRKVMVQVGHLATMDSGKHAQGLNQAQVITERAKAWRRVNRKRRTWVQLLDCNMDIEDYADITGAPNFFGRKPMVACYSRGWESVHAKALDVDGWDHRVLAMRAE